MDAQTLRFLTAYDHIDKWLRKILKADRRVSFSSLVDDASDPKRTHPRHAGVVRYYKDDLKVYGNLRNAIVHEHRNDEPIATPYPAAVKELETIHERLVAPPRAESCATKPVLQCDLDDLIVKVAQQMRQDKFSQVPVYRNSLLLALLTTDTIARWVALSLPKGNSGMENATVKDVMSHAEFTDNYRLLDPAATVIDALDSFDDRFHTGRRLDAILITEGAKKTNTPLGIISVSNIPKLLAALK